MNTQSRPCPQCGAISALSARFCGQCGSRITEAQSSQQHAVERAKPPVVAPPTPRPASIAAAGMRAVQKGARFIQEPISLDVVPPARWQLVVGDLPPQGSAALSALGRELKTRAKKAARRPEESAQNLVEQAEAAGPQLPAASDVSSKTHCPSCRSPLRPGIRFCGRCGTSLSSQEEVRENG